VRAHATGPAELDALETAAAGQPDVAAFVVSTKAQYFAWRGDPVAIDLADRGLTILPDLALPGRLALYARGRLRRARAIGLLLQPTADLRAEAEASAQASIRDFNRAGLVEEAASTTIYFHGFLAAVTGDGLVDAAETVHAAAERLRARESPMAPAAFATEAVLRLRAGNFAGAAASLACARSWERNVEPYVASACEAVDLLLRVATGTDIAGVAQEVDRVVSDLDRHAPELAWSMALTIAFCASIAGSSTCRSSGPPGPETCPKSIPLLRRGSERSSASSTSPTDVCRTERRNSSGLSLRCGDSARSATSARSVQGQPGYSRPPATRTLPGGEARPSASSLHPAP
jgi:hypothetical protein